MDIEKCRSDFIRNSMKNHGGRKILKYLGEINPDDIPIEQMEKYKTLHTGNEILIEYHMFEMIKSNIPLLQQWRLRVC